jgi:hypothetical protein
MNSRFTFDSPAAMIWSRNKILTKSGSPKNRKDNIFVQQEQKNKFTAHAVCSPVPEIIDPVFAKTSPKRSFSMTEYERFGLVFMKTRVYKFGHSKAVFLKDQIHEF